MKRIINYILGLILISSIVMTGLIPVPVFAAEREGFVWGVNGHSPNFVAYPESKLEQQIKKAADLGITCYRTNLTPAYSNGAYNWKYIDNVIQTAEKYNIKIYAVIYDGLKQSKEELYQRAYDMASRYGTRIAYYQLGNEIDLQCMLGAQYDGSQSSHYNMTKYAELRDKLKSLSEGIKAGCPTAKRVINMTYKHTGFLELLQADGVEWDVNGLDWYSNMPDMTAVVNKIGSYPQNEIIIAEINSRNGTLTSTEQDQADYIRIEAANAYDFGHPKLKGYFIYELLDESQKKGGEGKYGLVRTTTTGDFDGDKLAYGAYKQTISDINSRQKIKKEISLKVNSSKMSVNGTEQEIDPGRDTVPVISDGRMLVPARAVVEALGGKIDLKEDSGTQTMVIQKDNITFTLDVGSNIAFNNGVRMELDVPAQIVNNRTMVPLRVVSEVLGANVVWNEIVQQVDIVEGLTDVNSEKSAIAEGSKALKIAGVKATSETEGNPATASCDGDKNTAWSADGIKSITYDLGEEKKVQGIKLAWKNGNDRQYKFTIEVSTDNSTWKPVVWPTRSREKTSELQSYGFNEISARYIRYAGTGNTVNSSNAIAEIEVYGK